MYFSREKTRSNEQTQGDRFWSNLRKNFLTFRWTHPQLDLVKQRLMNTFRDLKRLFLHWMGDQAIYLLETFLILGFYYPEMNFPCSSLVAFSFSIITIMTMTSAECKPGSHSAWVLPCDPHIVAAFGISRACSGKRLTWNWAEFILNTCCCVALGKSRHFSENGHNNNDSVRIRWEELFQSALFGTQPKVGTYKCSHFSFSRTPHISSLILVTIGST